MIGETVTHYRILEKVGAGGMGVVYRALDTRLGRYVAVKFLSAQHAEDASALDRFQREARAASSLNHPHICSLFDVGHHGDLPFFVMELLDGRTLRELIGGAPLPVARLLDLGVQIADALDYAHSLGVVHRDIKSANIVVTSRGHAKVLDFGLAKLQQRLQGTDPYGDTAMGVPSQHTAAGDMLGTLSCMSPEQARGEAIDARTDLFSFGVVLYEMATGREPFAGKTPALIFDALLSQTPPAASASNSEIPAELDQIIARALEKDRNARPQNAADMGADLARLKRDSGSMRSAPAVGSVLATDPTQVITVPARGPSRRWVLAAAGLVAVIAAATGLTWWLTRAGRAPGPLESIAVLPFVSGGESTDNDYLSDGLTESLINGLAQLPGLRVSARSVVFRYKGREVDPVQAGRELGVNAVVTGRVSMRGNRLVIQADLINPDGTQLWGNQYNRATTDLLEVQDEIAREILDKLSLRLTGDEKKRVTRRYTEDAAAYQLYLQGRYHWNKSTIAGYKRAIECFQQAIGKDPKYALAYAGLADSHLLLGSYWVESITEAKAAAERALEIDPSLAEAHVAVGHIKLWLDWDWPAAEREFKQGIALSQSSPLAHQQYAKYLVTLGRTEEAIAETQRALDLEPLSVTLNSDLGWHLLYAGRRPAAIAQFRKTLELDPNSMSAHQGLGIACSEDGRHDEAVTALTRALELSENSPVIMGHLGAANARRHGQAAADAALRDLTALSTRQYVPASAFAVVYAATGDRTRALDALEKALDEHDFSMALVNTVPWYQPLRTEPRFRQLVAKLGLPR